MIEYYSSMQVEWYLTWWGTGKRLRQLPGVDEAGGDEIPGRIDEVVEVATGTSGPSWNCSVRSGT
jgi:hypothetical protein